MRFRYRMLIAILALGIIPIIVATIFSLRAAQNYYISIDSQLSDFHRTVSRSGSQELTPLQILTNIIAINKEASNGFGAVRNSILFIGALILLLAIGGSKIAVESLTRPFERIANTAKSSLQTIKTLYPNLPPLDITDDISLTSQTLHIIDSEIKDDLLQLRNRVELREKGIHDRISQYKLAAEIVREATNILDIDRILQETAQLITTRFGFYHTGIYLIDHSGEYAVLTTTDQDSIQRLFQPGLRLPISERGIVNMVAANGEPYISADTENDYNHIKNERLPNTHSEVAVPMKSRGNVVGVLDVQSTTTGSFSEEDVSILQIIADQISLALDNARLLKENLDALESTRRLYGETTAQAWQEIFQTNSSYGYISTPRLSTTIDKVWNLETQRAFQKAEPIVSQDGTTLNVPIRVRERPVGVISLKKPANGIWSQEEIRVAETISDQLSSAVDSARLFEETIRRADRERTVSEITTKIRSSNDPQVMLQTALDELKRALGAEEIEVLPKGIPTEKSQQIKSETKVPKEADNE